MLKQHVRYVIVGLNIILIIFGNVMMAIGTLWAHKVGHSAVLADVITTNGSLLLFIGGLLILSASFGLYTVYSNNVALVALHAVLLLSSAFLHFCIVIYSFVEFQKLDTLFHGYTAIVVGVYYNAYERNITMDRVTLENLQERMLCCGAHSYKDYAAWFKISLPASCCKDLKLPCTDPFRDGCIEAIVEKTRRDLKIGGALSVVVTIIAVACAGFVYYNTKQMMEEIRENEDEDDE